MEEDEDIHVCLACQSTIYGLQNYVHHRKVECAARKTLHKPVVAVSSGHSSMTLSQVRPSATLTLSPPQIATANTTIMSSLPSAQTTSASLTLANLIKSLSSSERDAINALTHSNLFDQQQNTSSEMSINISFPGKLPVKSKDNTQVSLEVPSTLASMDSVSGMQPSVSHNQESDSLALDVSDAVASMVAGLSPNTSQNIVDNNIVLYEHDSEQKDPALNDFFSSLELQSKAPESSKPTSKEDRLDHHKALRISNILNELAFSSDSEDFFPDDGHAGLSDKEEAVNVQHQPPHSHTGGKWGPEHARKRITAGKQGPDQTRKPSIGGKWKPNGKLEAMRAAKGKSSVSEQSSPCGPPLRRCTRLRGKKRRRWDLDEEDSDEEEKIKDNNKKNKTPKPTSVLPDKTRSSKQTCAIPGKTQDEWNSGEEEEGGAQMKDPVYGQGKGKGKSWSTLKKINDCMEFQVKIEGESDEDSPDKQDKGEDHTTVDAPTTVVEGTYFCRTCNRTLTSQQSYERHCNTAYHKKHAKGPQDSSQPVMVKEEEPIECTICLKSFNYKYNFARHLASTYHLKRARMCSTSLLLDESCQVLLLRQSRFQCLICNFFTSRSEYLYQHMLLSTHKAKVSSLIGPLMCVRCKLCVKSNEEMLVHLKTQDHTDMLAEAKRPCIIKESRNNVKCEHCSNVLHSATALSQHLKLCCSKASRRSRGQSPEAQSPSADAQGPPSGNKHNKPLCPHCGHQFRSNFLLKIHIRRRHTKEKPYHCETCDRSFADKYALELHTRTAYHLKQATGVPQVPRHFKVLGGGQMFKCRHCDFKVKRYRDLRGHYLSNHANKMVRCEPCGLSFLSDTMYTAHANSQKHKNKLQVQEETTDPFSCEDCGAIFPTKKKLILHMMGHKVKNFGAESFCGENISRVLLGVNPDYHDFVESIRYEGVKKLLKCPGCARKMNKINLIPHLRKAHGGSPPYKCDICIRGFYNAPSLKVHLQRHLRIQDFKCDHCEKSFMRKNHLLQHIMRKHPPEDAPRDYICSICCKRFISKLIAEQHERNHVRSYKCQYAPCRYSFRSKLELEAHHNTHTDNRPFLCDTCGYKARSKRQLGYHRKRHLGIRNYHCDYCEYKGSTKAHLQRHMRIHVGAKPFQCPYCSYRCNTLDNLGKHVQKTRKHTGLPMYPCRLCKYGATTSKDFRDHLFNEHNIEDSQVGVVSAYIGIYHESLDQKELPEGALAIPVRERKSHADSLTQKDTGKVIGPPMMSSLAHKDYTVVPISVSLVTESAQSTAVQEEQAEDEPVEITVVWEQEHEGDEPETSQEVEQIKQESVTMVSNPHVITQATHTIYQLPVTDVQTPSAPFVPPHTGIYQSVDPTYPAHVASIQTSNPLYPMTNSFEVPNVEVAQITKVLPVPLPEPETQVIWLETDADGVHAAQHHPLLEQTYITEDVASCVEVSSSSQNDN